MVQHFFHVYTPTPLQLFPNIQNVYLYMLLEKRNESNKYQIMTYIIDIYQQNPQQIGTQQRRK